MAEYTQERQLMRVQTTLGEDELMLERLTGKEAVSSPYLFELELLSENGEVDGEELLRSEVTIELDLPDGSVRPIHGIIRRFAQTGRDKDLTSYRAEVVPWLWFLSLRQDCRIFQEMDVLEIVEEVFKDQGYSDFDIRCTRDYEEREYCVQYRESNLNFVSRLLEEEGIFYFFEHDDSKHVLVLADDMSAVKDCDGQPEARMHSEPVPDEDVVQSLEREHAVHTGKVTLWDYDYLQPSFDLEGQLAGDEPEEMYDYPGGFDDRDVGEEKARLLLEREEALRHVVRGSGTCRAFRTGTRFELVDHFSGSADGKYALLEIQHDAHDASYRAGRSPGELDYTNRFVAIPEDVPYRPPRQTRKPVIQGVQTARVVGAKGEGPWVDEHARVRVQFHWDRKGDNDEGSSLPVRVSQNWAGKKWGGMFIPHIGQEVIVDFLEGDPDRPIITGRVYNEEQKPPLGLPDADELSIIRDHKGNELVFDARDGRENVYLHCPQHKTAIALGGGTHDSVGGYTLPLTGAADRKVDGITFQTQRNLNYFISGNHTHCEKGDSCSVCEGNKAETSIGNHLDIKIGSKFEFVSAPSTKVEFSSKTEFCAETSIKWTFGEEHSIGGKSFKQHTHEELLIKSDKATLAVGGDKDQSMMHGDSKALTLQYGSNSSAKSAKKAVGSHVATVGGAIGTLTGLVTGVTGWDVDDDVPDWAHQAALVGGLLGGGVAVGVPLFEKALKQKKEGKALPSSLKDHGTVHSTVTLNDKHIQLETGSSKLEVEKDGAIKNNTASGKQFRVESGDTNVKATGQVNLNGDAGINLKAKKASTVKVNGKTIKIG